MALQNCRVIPSSLSVHEGLHFQVHSALTYFANLPKIFIQVKVVKDSRTSDCSSMVTNGILIGRTFSHSF